MKTVSGAGRDHIRTLVAADIPALLALQRNASSVDSTGPERRQAQWSEVEPRFYVELAADSASRCPAQFEAGPAILNHSRRPTPQRWHLTATTLSMADSAW